MESVQHEEITGVLNETTLTVHKHEMGAADFHTPCGHTHHVEKERLRKVEITHITEELDVSKCGQCFEYAGGY